MNIELLKYIVILKPVFWILAVKAETQECRRWIYIWGGVKISSSKYCIFQFEFYLKKWLEQQPEWNSDKVYLIGFASLLTAVDTAMT